ncbi:pilus assembly protein TadD [Vibrio pectenicida]|uniref:tetratricopeptide repeat protein n=2 Tax=Vibrio pectenicida TaxID=62763 RepID=UPI00308167EC
MKIFFIIIYSFFLILGCATHNDDLEVKENLLLNSNDRNKVIEFYKENINLNSTYKVRLVNIYLDINDLDSAELYAKTYSSSELEKSEFIYSLARISYQKKKYNQAKQELDKYLKKKGDKCKYFILLGKINSASGGYQEAIENFEESRKLGALDKETDNNIAVVKMMQKDYLSAIDILYNLYLESPNDEKVKANLILSAAHQERTDIILEVLKGSHTDEASQQCMLDLIKLVSKDKSKNEASKQSNMTIPQSYKKPQDPLPISAMPQSKQCIQDKVIYPKPSSSTIKKNYKIQVLATDDLISEDLLNYLKVNYGPVYLYNHGFWKRYCIGEFSNLRLAKAFLRDLQIKGAFIVDYKNKRYETL